MEREDINEISQAQKDIMKHDLTQAESKKYIKFIEAERLGVGCWTMFVKEHI
jgi:hypothetical protein